MKRITLNLGLNNCPSNDESINIVRYINLIIAGAYYGFLNIANVELHGGEYLGESEPTLVVDVLCSDTPELKYLEKIAQDMNQDCIAVAVYERDNLGGWVYQYGALKYNQGRNIDKMEFDLKYFIATV